MQNNQCTNKLDFGFASFNTLNDLNIDHCDDECKIIQTQKQNYHHFHFHNWRQRIKNKGMVTMKPDTF